MVRPQIYQLSVAPAFHGPSAQEKLYAHHLARYWPPPTSPHPGNNTSNKHSRAAWNGTRVILSKNLG
ncbi:hypothetical protein BO71DRAFT_399312 [Aspergillus ellipticus CBS 707.79]|uniref:Uncharacterized protein n=1 Tax=Aspergillus ellipticus CBS 707.79 TaxID=1448320 RepID=A0A319DRJ7_9EURO|nr:hypothetical protein BO71DRAFT_399312 [Aspergillus ellipticus CBS 707.79]